MRAWPILLIAALVVVPAGVHAQAQRQAKIDVELATEAQASPTAMQQWFEILRDLKVDNLRARTAGAADGPSVTAVDNAGTKEYRVVGVVSRNGDLLLSTGRYRMNERGRLGDYLTKLRRYGPEGAAGGGRGQFGLAKEQVDALRADLARPVTFATKGVKPAEIVHAIADQLRPALTSDAASAKQLERGAPLASELRGLSMGTALAFVLDQEGLALVPRLNQRGEVALAINTQRPGQECWPVGWTAREPRRDLVPTLFDTVDVELDKVELPRVLAAVGEHVQVPILVDVTALAADKIDFATTRASLPAKRTMYEIVLRKVLVPQRIAHEVRVDEANKPFLWLSTARKVSMIKSKEAAK